MTEGPSGGLADASEEAVPVGAAELGGGECSGGGGAATDWPARARVSPGVPPEVRWSACACPCACPKAAPAAITRQATHLDDHMERSAEAMGSASHVPICPASRRP
ncbi:hypothetical protein GCM10018966_080110 [Streptomyces yanii]